MLLRLTCPTFDIAVVGGGPAGAWTAYILARRGARVAIVDGSHPREKPCGGGLSARALELLRPLAGSRPIRGIVITSRHASATDALGVDIDLPPAAASTPALLVASRRDLDLTLLDAARAAPGPSSSPERVTGDRTAQTRAGRSATPTAARIECGAPGRRRRRQQPGAPDR